MAYDKINLNDLFDFGDDSELQKAEKAIQRLQQVYQGLQDGIKTKNEEARKSIQALARSLTTLEKKLQAVNIASAEGRKQAAAYAQQVSNDVRVINELRVGQEKLTKQIGQLEAQNRRLQSAYDKLVTARQKAAKATQAEAGSITHLKQQAEQLRKSFEALAPSVDRAVKEQAINRMNRLQRAIQLAQGAMLQARKGAIGAAASYAGLVQENAKLTKQLREMPNAFDRVTGAINRHNHAAVKLQKQVQANNMALKAMDSQMGLNQRNVGNYGQAAVQGMKQFALALAGQYIGVMALAEATRAAFRANLELSDAQAGVQKTVGMTKEEVDRLAGAFKQIDTRTTLNGLFEIARVGGQFNVAEEDIEAFTVAADKAAVALGDEFTGGVQQVATELYTLRGLFAETREQSPADAMLAIGSAINSLGAQGAATGPVIAEFATRLGQLGDMGPSIDVALGMGAALQEMGLSAEIAAGGYTNLIIQANKHATKFAQLLGMSEQAFRSLLKSDPNEMLLKVAETVYGMEDGIKVMYDMGVQSQESIKVLQSMGDRLDFVRGKLALSNQAFTEATSIGKEFNTMNNTMAASWEKLKNTLIQGVASGTMGNVFKVWIDSINDFLALFGKVENRVAATTQATISSARATIEHAADLETLVDKYNEAVRAQGDYVVVTEEMEVLLTQIRQRHGENLVAIDKETGALELNMEAYGKLRNAYRDATTAAQQKAIAADENIKKEKKALEGSIKLAKIELKLAAEGREAAYEQASVTDRLTFFTGKLGEARDMQEEKQKQLNKLTKEYNHLLLTEQAIGQDLIKTLSAMQVLGWNTPKGLPVSDPTVSTKEQGVTPDRTVKFIDEEIDRLKTAQEAMSDSSEVWKSYQVQILALEQERERITGKQKEDTKSIVDAAREARHELAKLRKEAEIDDAEARFEDAAWDAEFELRAAQRLHASKLKLLEEERDEKLRHNEAGKDGVLAIEQEFQNKKKNLEREQKKREQKIIDDRVEAERIAAEKIMKIKTRMTDKDIEERERAAQNALAKGELERAAADRLAQDIEDAKLDIMQAGFDLASEMVASFYSLQQMYADLALEHLQHNKQQELDTVGDNAEAKAEIEENYRKQELKLRQRQAKMAKQEALFQIALSTAQAVMSAMASPAGPPFTFILAGLAAAMGTVQAATVMARPLPAYFTGTDNAKAGWATVAEQGAELIQGRSGGMQLVEKPSIVKLKGGEKIYDARETEGILSRSERVQQASGAHALVDSYEASHRAILRFQSEQERGAEKIARQIGMYTSRVTDAVGRQQQLHVSINRDGVSVGRRNGQQFNQYENTKYRRR